MTGVHSNVSEGGLMFQSDADSVSVTNSTDGACFPLIDASNDYTDFGEFDGTRTDDPNWIGKLGTVTVKGYPS
jgi:hypothetical protein